MNRTVEVILFVCRCSVATCLLSSLHNRVASPLF